MANWEDLEGKSSEKDKNEIPVVEKVLKNVEVFASNFPAIDKVEDLKEYECVVNACHAFLFVYTFCIITICIIIANANCWIILIVEYHANKHEYHDDSVPKRNANNLSPNSFRHYLSVLFDRRSSCNSTDWWFSWESDSSESVHYHIDP